MIVRSAVLLTSVHHNFAPSQNRIVSVALARSRSPLQWRDRVGISPTSLLSLTAPISLLCCCISVYSLLPPKTDLTIRTKKPIIASTKATIVLPPIQTISSVSQNKLRKKTFSPFALCPISPVRQNTRIRLSYTCCPCLSNSEQKNIRRKNAADILIYCA